MEIIIMLFLFLIILPEIVKYLLCYNNLSRKDKTLQPAARDFLVFR